MMDKLRVQANSGCVEVSLLRPRVDTEIDEYDLLIEGMCRLAARDLLDKNDEPNRFDAMDFFRSNWFKRLTNLDGEMIIDKLLGE